MFHIFIIHIPEQISTDFLYKKKNTPLDESSKGENSIDSHGILVAETDSNQSYIDH